MAKLYGIGAAVVIVGALFKIQHWPFASLLLIVGLSTEAVIFFFSAFEPIHEEPDWSLVYPELAHGEQRESGPDQIAKGGSLTEQLDGMLMEAKIDSIPIFFRDFS
ncbi:MAG: gliding motility protein GldL [Flavobacteriales bacterium]|nr:gliding motility protein GldL [Flavobacteriales bacterium]